MYKILHAYNYYVLTQTNSAQKVHSNVIIYYFLILHEINIYIGSPAKFNFTLQKNRSQINY